MASRRSSCTASRTIRRRDALPRRARPPRTSRRRTLASRLRAVPDRGAVRPRIPYQRRARADRPLVSRASRGVGRPRLGRLDHIRCLRHRAGADRTRGHARNPPPAHVPEPAAPRSATPELVHGALSTAGKRLYGHRPRSRPHRPPLASVVAQPLARSSSPGGATRAPAGEHARASKVLPGDAATRHARGDAPPVSADHGAPAAAPRCRRRLLPPPQVDDRHRFAAPHARQVVADVGHFLHIEAPEAIAERIAAWAQ